jgi:hypothetical protein
MTFSGYGESSEENKTKEVNSILYRMFSFGMFFKMNWLEVSVFVKMRSLKTSNGHKIINILLD